MECFAPETYAPTDRKKHTFERWLPLPVAQMRQSYFRITGVDAMKGDRNIETGGGNYGEDSHISPTFQGFDRLLHLFEKRYKKTYP
ncbi:MAG: hypothetical protein F6J93_37910 [Oscillatoria sp. SIO1A7]|nr:hypothetical protein [Oscillatoria sp. SIO1A7]